MHHYECVALCKDITLQRGRFCARSLASYIPISSKDRSSWMFFIQAVCGRPGGRLQFSGASSKMAWLASVFSSIRARCPVKVRWRDLMIDESGGWLVMRRMSAFLPVVPKAQYNLYCVESAVIYNQQRRSWQCPAQSTTWNHNRKIIQKRTTTICLMALVQDNPRKPVPVNIRPLTPCLCGFYFTFLITFLYFIQFIASALHSVESDIKKN